MVRRTAPLLAITALVVALTVSAAGATGPGALHRSEKLQANAYRLRKLVSDVPGAAAHLDPNLVNAWGLAAGPQTPWWLADNGTDLSTLYDGMGTVLPLVVRVGGAPTGLVFNGGTGFVVSHGANSGSSLFLFSTESGKIRGWNPGVGPGTPSTKSFIVASRSFAGASYKGLAIASGPTGDMLYATDFHNGHVDVFDPSFHRVLRNAFVDPGLPAGYAPFGIQAIDGTIFVTFAKQDADAGDEVAGPGLGFVDMFDTQGVFLGRVASRHALNAPWGLAWAPADFGKFGGDLLVGNFGDGRVNAYEPQSNGTFLHRGVLRGANDNILTVDGLWALEFGNDAAAGSSSSLYFTAGPADEAHGLFGRIDALT
jgi:uncharacterized protein (TIGR03118 family)